MWLLFLVELQLINVSKGLWDETIMENKLKVK